MPNDPFYESTETPKPNDPLSNTEYRHRRYQKSTESQLCIRGYKTKFAQVRRWLRHWRRLLGNIARGELRVPIGTVIEWDWFQEGDYYGCQNAWFEHNRAIRHFSSFHCCLEMEKNVLILGMLVIHFLISDLVNMIWSRDLHSSFFSNNEFWRFHWISGARYLTPT